MVDAQTEAKINSCIEIHPLRVLEGHTNGVDSVKFNPAKKTQLISGSFDHSYRVWDSFNGTCAKDVKAHEGGIWSIDFSSDGKTFVTASADKTLKIWDAATLKEEATLKGHTTHVYSVAFSPNGSQLLSSGEDATIRVWDVKKKAQIKTVDIQTKIGLCVQYSQDGRFFFVSTSEGELIAFDANTYTELDRTPKIEKIRAYSLSLDFATPSKFQSSVFVAYEDHHVRRWKFENGKLSLETDFISHVDHCKHILVIASLGVFVTCGRDGSAKVWDAANNDLLYNLVGATDTSTMSAFAHDATNTLAVSAWDQRVRIYEIPAKHSK